MDVLEKLEKMKCSECGGYGDGEYFFRQERDPYPLCKDCLATILIDENSCNIAEIQDLDDTDEVDIEIINKLWEQQKEFHI